MNGCALVNKNMNIMNNSKKSELFKKKNKKIIWLPWHGKFKTKPHRRKG